MAWTTPATFTSGQILTAAQMNTNVRDNTNALYGSLRRIGYESTSSNITISATSIATATDAFTDITWTAEAATYLIVASWATWVGASGYNYYAYLTDGGNNGIACLGQISGADRVGPCTAIYFYTVTAGSKTINMRFTKESGGANGTVEATAAAGREVAGVTSLALYGTVLS